MNYLDDRYLQHYLKNKVRDQKALIRELRKELHEERFKNLRMRLDLMVLMESPGSKAADRIRHRYNLKAVILHEGIEVLKN